MNRLTQAIGHRLAVFVTRQHHAHGTSRPTPPERLRACLEPGDVLLVEGHSRASTAIKYLTQSTWSHAALFVGPLPGRPEHCFVEADLVDGVRSVGFEEFAPFHTRICRPVGLSAGDRDTLCKSVIARLGHRYDLRNVFDLARYLLPTLPMPARFRRRMIRFGSGDPTRAICSTLIAQAFETIGYPVLPLVELQPAATETCPECQQEILHVRHHSLYAPRDFDVSPYFRVVKPTVEEGFDYSTLLWSRETAA